MAIHDRDPLPVITVDPHTGQCADLVRRPGISRCLEPGIGIGLGILRDGLTGNGIQIGRGVAIPGISYRFGYLVEVKGGLVQNRRSNPLYLGKNL